MSEIKIEIENELSKRDYYSMFKIIDKASNEYLDGDMKVMETCVELITDVTQA
jgi:hypothetical protein